MLNKIFFVMIFLSTLWSQDDFEGKFNYFGNISASGLSNEGYYYHSYNHDSITNNLSLAPHSKIGAQFSYSNDDFSFTAQGLSRQNQDRYRAELTWLNVKYNYNDNINIRIGRIQTKVLLNSESLDVDYLQLWDKAPEEVYRLMPVRTYNGIEINYNKTFGEYNFNVSIVPYGFYNGSINGNKDRKTDLDITGAHSICLKLESDNFIYKASYSRSQADISDDPTTLALVNGLRAYGNDMSRFTYKDRIFKVYSLGFRYVNDDFSLDAEFARSKTDGFFPSSTGGYVLLGYKLNDFTPYVMLAENKNDKAYYNTDGIVAVDATSAYLKRGLDDLLYLNNFSQKTSSIGLRYDIKIGMSIKAQVDRISTTNYGSITAQTVQAVGYEKMGILGRSVGQIDQAIYAYSVSLSFAY